MSTALSTVRQKQELMPAMTFEQVVGRFNAVVHLYKEVMKEGLDYGTVGQSTKPTLLKPGAEKLCTLFGLVVEDPDVVTEIEDWTGKDHHGEALFYYKIRQRLTRDGNLVASQFGSCNSWESKYRYRWVQDVDVPPGLNRASLKTRGGKISEFCFSVDKAETGGQYGKPADYWQRFRDAISNGTAKTITKTTAKGKSFEAWEIDSTLYRVPNTDPADIVNTIQKMAQKRALVAATLVATNASELFTQDLEEIDDAEYHVVPPRATEAPPAEKPAPVAPAPKPAPPAATAPTNGNGKHNVMPKDGSELFARLKAKEKELVDAQHCEEGALLKYVRSAVVPKGHDQDMRNWNADAIRLAVDALKKFLHDLSPIGLEGAQKLEDLIYKGGGTWDKVLPEINLPKDFTYANLNHFEERLILALLAKKQPEPEEVPI